MEVNQSNFFKNAYKKLHKNQLLLVNKNIKMIIDDPETGELKIGDLHVIRVHKFKLQNHLYLIAYDYKEMSDLLYLIAIGEHENFYDKIKKMSK